MKRWILTCLAMLTLTACTQAQSDRFQAGLTRFENGVIAVDQTISRVSPLLARHCDDLAAVGAALAVLVATTTSNTKAQGGLSAANAVIGAYCVAPPQSISSAITTVAAQVVAAKAAYKAAQQP